MFVQPPKLSQEPAKVVEPQEVQTEKRNYDAFAGNKTFEAGETIKKQKIGGGPGV